VLKRKNRYDFLRRLAGLCLPICMAVTLVPPSIVSAASNSETIALLESEISRLGLEVIGKVTEIKKDKDVVNIKLSTGESIRISFLDYTWILKGNSKSIQHLMQKTILQK
jgi:N6-adenosine-specific RNA methylase IME4